MRCVIIGAGGHGREVLATVERINLTGAGTLKVIGFLDDALMNSDRQIAGIAVLGPVRTSTSLLYEAAVLGVGYPEVKRRLSGRINQHALMWPTLIDPHAVVGPRITRGGGVFIQAGAVLTADIEVNDFATINVGASVSHDCILGAYSTISPGARLGGAVKVGEGAFVGIGASVVQGISIGEWSTVGAGSVVTANVPPGTIVAGVPAKIIRTRPRNWYQ